MNSTNLALRFFLELAALTGWAVFGWHAGAGALRFVLALALALGFVALWGIFNVPDDPSRSGHAPIAVRGWVRLALEICLLCGGALGFELSGQTLPAAGLFLLILVHYGLSIDRIRWMLRR